MTSAIGPSASNHIAHCKPNTSATRPAISGTKTLDTFDERAAVARVAQQAGERCADNADETWDRQQKPDLR
jgi:hypothetical protein